MKYIELTQGQVAIVDDDQYEELNRHKWCAVYSSETQSYYAIRGEGSNGKKKSIYMHRQILNAQPGEMVDHKNHQTLDNRISNIRLCTNAENSRNQRRYKNNASGMKGVAFDEQNKKWKARISFSGKAIFLGLFHSKIEAACAYDKAARKYHGEFAYTNFPVPIGKTLPLFMEVA